MLPRVVGKLNNKQISALSAASNAVDVRDMRALGCCSLQDAVHLGIGGVDKLDDGAGFLRRDTRHCLLLFGYKADTMI